MSKKHAKAVGGPISPKVETPQIDAPRPPPSAEVQAIMKERYGEALPPEYLRKVVEDGVVKELLKKGVPTPLDAPPWEMEARGHRPIELAPGVATPVVDAPAVEAKSWEEAIGNSIDDRGHSPTEPDPPIDTTGGGQEAIGSAALPEPLLMNVKISDLVFIESRSDIPTLLRRMNAQKICEVGVLYGGHFRSLISAECVAHAVAVDLWTETGNRAHNDECHSQSGLDEQYAGMLALAKEDNRVQVIKNYSPVAAEQFADGYFDFVYLDDDHTEAGATISVNAWFPKVRSGGVLAGHDFFEWSCGPVKFGVVEAVTKFVKEHGFQLHLDKQHAAGWFIPKP